VPELSVIIPTHNRAAKLRTCLEALSRQTLSAADFEVIVVNDGSTDDTAAMLAQMKMPFSLRVINRAQSGQCAARNYGVEIANRYCLFLDDDIIPSPEWAAEHLKAQQAHQGAVVIGPLKSSAPDEADWYAHCFAKDWAGHYARLDQGVRPPLWRDCYSGNMSVPREALLEVGGFAVDLPAEFDVELGYRLQCNDVPIVYAPAAQGEHDDYKPARRLIRDDEQQGRVWPDLIQRHPALLTEILKPFWNTSPRAIWLRQFLLNAGLPPHHLLRLKPLFYGKHWMTEWFRFIRAYAFWFGLRQAMPNRDLWRRWMSRTPVLMYHAFGKPGEPPSRYILPRHRFAQQMAWLKLLGYHVISLEDYLRYRREGGLLPERSVVITADDGYADNYSVAFPILHHYGFPATFFLVSGNVGDTNRWDEPGLLGGRALMTWNEIREMLRGGMTFGAHTRTHPMLTAISPDCARAEVTESREELEQGLGQPIQAFSYPYGKYDVTSLSIVEQAGFLGACTARPGMNSFAIPDFEIRRIEVRGTDSFLRFMLALWLGDDSLPPRRGRHQ
jgi:peptidoglycan/xylan/chitin deacetylase (PgdA/CDA1 family)/glycosyltransferase involved in cell wall biosynthesis